MTWMQGEIRRVAQVSLGKMLQTSRKSENSFRASYVSAVAVQDRGLDHHAFKTMYFEPDEAEKLAIRKDDVLVVEGGSVGRSAYIESDLKEVYFQNSINRIRPYKGKSTGKFLFYVMSHLVSSGTVENACNKATIMHLTAEKLARLPLSIPPLEQQRAIADFLDRETAEIDAFIADQERLIELLTERRTATITHAVTKGLDPSVPMRDSGIPWLGEIPAHWQAMRFSHFVRINAGQVDPRDESYRDMTLIAPNHVESWTGRIRFKETAAEQGADSGKYFAHAGQVIFSKIRPTLMKTVIATENVLCSADMYALSTKSSVMSNEYLAVLLRSMPFHDYARDQSMRVAMPKLNHETLNAAVFPVPSLNEQAEVLRMLRATTSGLDGMIADARQAIELSKERRAALISAAVTGQIDVRTNG